MILLCEHPVARGCESAQSRLRSSSRRPGAPAGCSRCERCPDTQWLVERFHRRVIQVRFPESWSSTFSGKASGAHAPPRTSLLSRGTRRTAGSPEAARSRRGGGGDEQTFPLQENDSGLTPADSPFVKPL